MKKNKATVSFLGVDENVSINKAQYSNGRTAYLLICDTGEPFCNLTVNLVDEENVNNNQFFIKNSAPEFQIALQLEKMGLIKRTDRQAASGFLNNYATLWEEL